MTLRALTIHQPWAGAIAHLGKNIENRSWITHIREPFAIHAGLGTGPRWVFEDAIEHVIDRADCTRKAVAEATSNRGAVIAVAVLADVCSESLRIDWSSPPRCKCGPWAFNQHCHFRLADVRPLPEPIPCLGAQRLWRLPEDVDAAVRAQLAERAA